MAEEGWKRSVVKPAIGASGLDAFEVNTSNRGEVERTLEPLLRDRDFLLQPFLPQIAKDGEWSLVFFDGEYSHAVVKRAAPGEFRVHEEHGGSVSLEAADHALISQAQGIVDTLERPSYARVDGVVVDGVLLLVELELIEPELFFRANPRAPSRFVEAVARRVRR